MVIDKTLMDSLTEKAKASPRLRMNYDLRNTEEDQSQRMLNAIEPGSAIPIHRHSHTSETVAVLRGRIRENFYSKEGVLEESIEIFPGGEVVAINVPIGRWHNSVSLESGTVILEFKEGPYEPISEEDILNP